MVLGIFAQCGFAIGWVRFKRRPVLLHLPFIVLSSCLALFMPYWLAYLYHLGTTTSTDSFSDFVWCEGYYFALTNALPLGLGRYLSAFGITLLLNFAMLVFCGVIMFMVHREKPHCPDCDRFFRLSQWDKKVFKDRLSLDTYLAQIKRINHDSSEFKSRLSQQVNFPEQEGSARLLMRLNMCPDCQRQSLTLRVDDYEHYGWSTDVRQTTTLVLDKHTDLSHEVTPIALWAATKPD